MKKLSVVGITSGIGSLQYGFKQAGWNIEHSHEWRKYYNTGTFTRNYGKPVTTDYDLDSKFIGVDALVSHPECGNYSNLYTGPNRDKREADPGDIFQFIDLAKKYKPKFFLCDNLPRSLTAVPQTEWKKRFRGYNIQFEMVSNFGYGNTQKNRNRLFIIGSHKDLDFKFYPGERVHNMKMSDVIFDIKDNAPNHQKMKLTDITQWSSYQIGLKGNKRLKLSEIQNWFGSAKQKANLPYYNKEGELKFKPGYSVVDPDNFSPVLSGGGGFYDNHWIKDYESKFYRPLTMRERLRIQGFGDEFILDPVEFNFGSKEHQGLIKQTGKCMPVQFPQFFASQVKDFLLNGTVPDQATRILKSVDQILINFKN